MSKKRKSEELSRGQNKKIRVESMNPLELGDIVGHLLPFSEVSLPILLAINNTWHSLTHQYIKLKCQRRFGIKKESNNYIQIFAKLILPEKAFHSFILDKLKILVEDCKAPENVHQYSDVYNELYDILFPSLWKRSYMKLNWERILEEDLKRKPTTKEKKVFTELLNRIDFIDCSYHCPLMDLHIEFTECSASLNILSLTGAWIELTWFLQKFRDAAYGETEIIYSLEATIDKTVLVLADLFSHDSEHSPTDEIQNNFCTNVNNDFPAVKLQTENLKTLMTKLGVVGVIPVVFYKFLGIILAHRVEFPNQIRVPSLEKLIEDRNGKFDIDDQVILEAGICTRLQQHRYSVMDEVLTIIVEKETDSNSWPFLFNYSGPDKLEYFSQLRKLTLSLNILDYEVRTSSWQATTTRYSFEHHQYLCVKLGEQENDQVMIFIHRMQWEGLDFFGLHDFCATNQISLEQPEFGPENKWHYEHTNQVRSGTYVVQYRVNEVVPCRLTSLDRNALYDILIVALGQHKYITGKNRWDDSISYELDGESMRQDWPISQIEDYY